MNINIVCVGKIKEKFYRDAILEYAKRLSRFCKFNIIEVSEELLIGDGQKLIENVKQKEGERILDKCKGHTIALDLHGKELKSEELAKYIKDKKIEGESTITFIIGGSYGLSKEVLDNVNFKISFGNFTYPHQLMRVILSEQIYRAFMINEGSTYHK